MLNQNKMSLENKVLGQVKKAISIVKYRNCLFHYCFYKKVFDFVITTSFGYDH